MYFISICVLQVQAGCWKCDLILCQIISMVSQFGPKETYCMKSLRAVMHYARQILSVYSICFCQWLICISRAENRGNRNDTSLLYSPGMQWLEFHSQGLPKVGARTWYLIADEETCSTGRGGGRQLPWMTTRCREYVPFLGFNLLLLN